MIEDAFVRRGNEFYRKNVGAILINSQNFVFVGKRFGSFTNSWQMPQGGVGAEETEEQALIRELEEEVGIFNNIYNVKSISKSHHFYTIPKKMRKSAWNNLYVGQRQRWFLVEFKGKDEDINIKTEFPEFQEWAWFKPQEVIENAISFKKDIYEDILIEFNLL